MDAQILLDL